ncbi:uncharacterized protein Triagg1_2191 [Trichoderma aggressivum f. europaeum]|uniref:Uncharacterized protein n=1 Tax=Trichoderma aggressivum f. europaeum TaxID=173218 RepID=A0AAE1M2G5_9HYPO|nr:hypothetical protein Triagg1_2191 [Trichoderma aggressivum f. europaeum]
MTDEKDNSDSDWEHLQTMSEETPSTENGDDIENGIDESGNNHDEKEEGEPRQEENAKVEDETPPADTAKADEDKPPQDDSSKTEEDTSPQENPIKEEETPPHDSAVKDEDGEPSHDDSDKEEESEPPEDDRVKAKQSATPPENHPIPGKSFMIQTRNKPNLILALKYGKLVWLETPIPSGGHIWRCVEKDGWLGFRNMASGTYLGHNKEGKIVATQKEHKEQQRFTERRRENGGYMLSVLQEAALLGVAFSEDGKKSLVLQKGEGEALDFIDSKYLDSPVSLKYPNMPPQKLR